MVWWSTSPNQAPLPVSPHRWPTGTAASTSSSPTTTRGSSPRTTRAQIIDHYVAVNNLGTTSVLREFAPLLRDGGRLLVVASRAGSLRALAPVLHARSDGDLESLDDVDAAVCTWRDAVREGRAAGQAWPAWINIPSKIGQVAAVCCAGVQQSLVGPVGDVVRVRRPLTSGAGDRGAPC
jgi:hypothetical protein